MARSQMRIKAVLRQIGAWLRVNGEAIYETRPADQFGEGPTRIKEHLRLGSKIDFTAEDVRFTTRAHAFYVHVLGAPGGRFALPLSKKIPRCQAARSAMSNCLDRPRRFAGNGRRMDWKSRCPKLDFR